MSTLNEFIKSFGEEAVRPLAELIGDEKLAAAIVMDLSRVLPPPFSQLLFSGARSVLQSSAPDLLPTLSLAYMGLTVLSSLIRMIPVATLLALLHNTS